MEFRVPPLFYFGSEIKIEAKMFFCLEANKMHDLACFALQQNSNNLKQKRTGKKQNEAKKSMRNEKQPKNCLTKKKSGAKTNRK
jgi:hypothetical protein